MTTIAFEYLEIRHCIYPDDDVLSFIDETEFEAERARLASNDEIFATGWALYGRYLDEAGQFLAMAIGDFTEKDDAFKVMNAILAPMAKARDLLVDADQEYDIDEPDERHAYAENAEEASRLLTDFIAQSSDRERL